MVTHGGQTHAPREPQLVSEGPGCSPTAPQCIPGRIFTLGTVHYPQRSLQARSQQLEQAVKFTMHEPVPSTLKPW